MVPDRLPFLAIVLIAILGMRSHRQYRGSEFPCMAAMRNRRRDPRGVVPARLCDDAARGVSVAGGNRVWLPRVRSGVRLVSHLLWPGLMSFLSLRDG